MAPAHPGAAAPISPCAQEHAPLNLYALYHQQAACGYTRSLTLHATQAQHLTSSLRGINAITAVLMAESDDETLHLGNWLRAGLVEAVHSIAWSATNDLERINEHACKEQLQ